MTPVPEPSATTPTPAISAINAASGSRDSARAGVFKGVLIGALIAAGCGFGLATITGMTTLANAGPVAPGAAASADISGRWTGTPSGYDMIKRDCGPAGCKLVLDITACGDAWCGVRVETSGTDKSEQCVPGVAMRMTPKKPIPAEDEDTTTKSFEGKLELAAGSQPYVIEAHVWQPGTSDTKLNRQLRIIGDTGSEMLMLRRSFPLQATLERVADATCKSDKPVS